MPGSRSGSCPPERRGYPSAPNEPSGTEIWWHERRFSGPDPQCRGAATYREGHQVIVVVSAMAGQTDKLLSMGWELSNGPAEREMDVLASSGEQVSAALLAIQLNEIGVPARSMLGHQARILTDNVYRKARIRTIDGTGLRSSLETGNVLVVAGFQGTCGGGQGRRLRNLYRRRWRVYDRPGRVLECPQAQTHQL